MPIAAAEHEIASPPVGTAVAADPIHPNSGVDIQNKLQSHLNHCLDLGRTVRLPAGVIRCDAPVVWGQGSADLVGLSILGAGGAHLTVGGLDTGTKGTVIRAGADMAGETLFTIRGGTGTNVKGITFDANNFDWKALLKTEGIPGNGSLDKQIEDCSFVRAPEGVGILAESAANLGSADALVTNCYFGQLLHGFQQTTDQALNWIFTKPKFNFIDGAGFDIVKGGALTVEDGGSSEISCLIQVHRDRGIGNSGIEVKNFRIDHGAAQFGRKTQYYREVGLGLEHGGNRQTVIFSNIRNAENAAQTGRIPDAEGNPENAIELNTPIAGQATVTIDYPGGVVGGPEGFNASDHIYQVAYEHPVQGGDFGNLNWLRFCNAGATVSYGLFQVVSITPGPPDITGNPVSNPKYNMRTMKYVIDTSRTHDFGTGGPVAVDYEGNKMTDAAGGFNGGGTPQIPLNNGTEYVCDGAPAFYQVDGGANLIVNNCTWHSRSIRARRLLWQASGMDNSNNNWLSTAIFDGVAGLRAYIGTDPQTLEAFLNEYCYLSAGTNRLAADGPPGLSEATDAENNGCFIDFFRCFDNFGGSEATTALSKPFTASNYTPHTIT